jgi:N-acetylglucosaminyldiphosphoundecaprenol N-acetyl-beta-D-mannosaminyltransferase
VDALTAEEIVQRISRAIAAGDRLLIGNHNLHSTYLVRHDDEMQRFYERADLIYVDGMPLVLADRVRTRTLRRAHRSTLLDWVDTLLAAADAGGWRVHLLGGRPGVAETAAAHFAERHTKATFTSTHGYFADAAEEAQVLDELAAARPDLLLVGMGMPRQEAWLARRFDGIDAQVAIAVGGLFDYFAGTSVTPPRWMGKLGLEWLGRLVADPKRLGNRYLVEPILLGSELLRERRA